MSPPDEGEVRPSSHPTRPPSHPTRPPSVSTTPPTRARPDAAPDVAPFAVPTRVGRPGAGRELDVRAAFLLLHADGREDLASIGDLTALPFEEVRRVFAALLADGLVTLSVPREVALPSSRASLTTTPPPP
ncbi:MAG TPA: hypothetical protein PLR99_06500 [Polyangiaceae bacterium]|nr:hypothetical protein [Polyangiaceae bacterium]